MASVPLLERMDTYEKFKIADSLKELKFKSGEVVIKEGEQGDSFYLILEGEAFATKTFDPSQPPQKVKHYGVGDYFGERALLTDTPRAANVIAFSPVLRVVTLDRDSFKRLLGPLDHLLKI